MSDLDPGIRPDAAPLSEATSPPLDLDEIERDLRDVESALARLADGTYFSEDRASVTDTDPRPWATDSDGAVS
jgi:hypothetical protein